MKRIVIVTFLAVQLVAQNPVVRQGTSPSGDVDFSSARSTKPVRTGGTLPGACAANELYFLTNVGLHQCVKGKFTAVGNGGTWGTVGGAIAAQTDLWNTLQTKQSLLKGSPSQYVRGDGSLGSLAGIYEPMDAGILRSGSTYVNPSWTRFMSGGTGAVARTVDSKLSDVTSVKDYGAVGDGTTDDRASIQAALDTCNGSTWRTISLPAGHYKITSGLRINWSRCNLSGPGILVSYLDFAPTANGAAITISQGASIASGNSLSGFTVTSNDTTYEKTGILAIDVSGLRISNISISGVNVNGTNTFHDVTNSSIGLQLKGRDLSSIGPVSISADIPERFSKNPNVALGQIEDLDQIRFFDQTLVAYQNPNILVDDGVYFSNTTFDGFQSWNLGTHGLYWNNTKGASASYNLKITNVRWEQAESEFGYIIYLGGTVGAIQNLTISNIGGAATKSMQGTNGVYLRNIWGGLLENFRYTGTKEVLNSDATVVNFRLGVIHHPIPGNVYNTAGFTSFTKVEDGTFGSGVIDQPASVPFAFKENNVPPAPSGACGNPRTWYLYADTTTSAPHFMDCTGVPWFSARFQTKGTSGNGVKWNSDGTMGDLGYVPIPLGDVNSSGTVTKINGGTAPTSIAVLATNAAGQLAASTILTEDGTNLKVTGRNLSVGATVPTGAPAGSIGAVKFYGDVPITGKGTTTVAIGDSITQPSGTTETTMVANSWYSQLLVLSKGLVRNLHNAGIPGDTTSGMLGRFLADVVAYKPAKVFIMGGTNDIDAAYNTYSRLASMLSLAKAAGIEPILCVMPPTTSGENTLKIQRRALMYKLASDTGVRLIDFYSAVTDPTTGTWKTGYNTDNTHPNAVGSLVMAQTALAEVVKFYPTGAYPYMPKSNIDPLNATLNGQMVTDTNSDGVADSWAKNDITGSTATYAITTDSAGIKWQSIQKTNASAQSQVTQVIPVTSGNRIAISARVKSSGIVASGATIGMFLWPIGGGVTLQPITNWPVDYTDGLVYFELLVPPGVTGYMWSFVVMSGTGTLQFTQVAVVDLTANGLQ